MQTLLHHSECTQRTQESHNDDILKLFESNAKHVNGVKSENCFSKLSFYTIVNGIAPDIMHDFLEGVFPYELSLMITKLSDLKIIKIKELANNLANFNYGRIDAKFLII